MYYICTAQIIFTLQVKTVFKSPCSLSFLKKYKSKINKWINNVNAEATEMFKIPIIIPRPN